jgi:hypothetical protein
MAQSKSWAIIKFGAIVFLSSWALSQGPTHIRSVFSLSGICNGVGATKASDEVVLVSAGVGVVYICDFINHWPGGASNISAVHALGTRVIGEGDTFIPQPRSVVDVRDYGVVGDGKLATDCTITAGSTDLNCASEHFFAVDVGKAITVWNAGIAAGSGGVFPTPLSTAISAYVTATEITLASPATTTVNPSPHTVWGTNNYAALNAARESANALYPSGYNLFFPSGYYLTPTLEFPCGAVGTFGSFRCPSATQNITISGASQTSTIIENFKWDRTAPGSTGVIECPYTYNCGLIMFGEKSTNGGALNDPAHWVNGISIHDLRLLEVQNAEGTFFNNPLVISLSRTSNSEVFNTDMENSAYVCIGGGNPSSKIHDNYFRNCGWGGPAYAATQSAIVANTPGMHVYRNHVYYSMQGIEGGAPNSIIEDNYFDKRDDPSISTHLPPYPSPGGSSVIECLNIGSTNYGMWSAIFRGNICKDWALGGGGASGAVTNGSGILSNILIEGNSFINSGAFTLTAGVEGPSRGWVNLPVPQTTTNIHGTSIFRNNTFRYDKDVTVNTQNLGVAISSVQEKWIVENIDVLLPSQASNCGSCVGLFLSGSSPAWQPSTTYILNTNHPSVIQPPMPNGFYYEPQGASGACTAGATIPIFPTTVGRTVVDNTCTWKNMAAKPVHSVSNFNISFPAGSTNGNNAIQNSGMLSTDIQFSNITNSGATSAAFKRAEGILFNVNGWSLSGFPQESWAVGNDAYPSTTRSAMLRAGRPYGSSDRSSLTDDTLQVGEYFRANDRVTKTTIAAGVSSGWHFNSTGWHGKSWVLSNAYPYNSMVESLGHLFIALNAGTSGGSAPSWNTGTGTNTIDNTITWKEAGLAATFRAVNVMATPTDDGTTRARRSPSKPSLAGATSHPLQAGARSEASTSLRKASAVWRFVTSGNPVNPNESACPRVAAQRSIPPTDYCQLGH